MKSEYKLAMQPHYATKEPVIIMKHKESKYLSKFNAVWYNTISRFIFCSIADFRDFI